MIRRMAVKVAELSDRKNDVDIIEYGLEAIFNGFLNMSVIILVGVVFHATSEAGIFLIMNIIGNGTLGGIIVIR